MFPYKNSRVISFFLILFFFLIAGYSYFEVRNILFGPGIAISGPNNGITVSKPLMAVRGQTKHIKSLYLNGSAIPVTSEGVFEETVVLLPGFNEIVLSAEDSMGRETKKVLAIVYKNGDNVATSTTTSATSTPPIETDSETI